MAQGNGASSGLFRLNLGEPEPFWLEVLPARGGNVAIEFLVKPYDSRVHYAATFESIAMRDDLKEMINNLRKDVGESIDQEEFNRITRESAWTRGEQWFNLIIALAKRVVIDWKGVGRWDSDEPLAFSPIYLEQLLTKVPQVAENFNIRYDERGKALEQEKKVSGSSPNGSAGQEAHIATDATIGETPVLTEGSEPPGSAPS